GDSFWGLLPDDIGIDADLVVSIAMGDSFWGLRDTAKRRGIALFCFNRNGRFFLGATPLDF
ncbi:MAG: hypothetical protein KDE48_04600, partial [Anaerolineales bacterium]|nr:hypothetical protein [Anaerolineales bacterium]